MAVRYSKRDQNKLVNRVKKLIAEGKTVNAACTAVSEREGGQPATNTLANWVKAAGLSDGEATPVEAPAAPKRPRRAAKSTTRKPATAPATTAEKPVEAPAPEPAEAPVAESPAISDTETLATEAVAPERDSIPDAESEQAPAAELVRVQPLDTTPGTTNDLDDLLDENLRLRTALNEANREIRAMRDLVVVYASR